MSKFNQESWHVSLACYLGRGRLTCSLAVIHFPIKHTQNRVVEHTRTHYDEIKTAHQAFGFKMGAYARQIMADVSERVSLRLFTLAVFYKLNLNLGTKNNEILGGWRTQFRWPSIPYVFASEVCRMLIREWKLYRRQGSRKNDCVDWWGL